MYDDNAQSQQTKKIIDDFFLTLVQTYECQLYRFASRLIKSQQDAEDIVQETFVRAYNALKSYTPEKINALQLKPWLYTILRHVALNYTRDLHTRYPNPLASLDQLEQDISTEKDTMRVIDDAEIVREALDQVSPQYRTCLELQDVCGFSQREIASRLNITVGCVSAYISRGRSQFRQIFEQIVLLA